MHAAFQQLAIAVIIVALGFMSGMFIDQILWAISFDFVEAPNMFYSEGHFWGLAFGAIAVVFTIDLPAQPLSHLCRAMFVGVLTMIVFAIMVAVGFYFAEKWFPTDPASFVFTSPRHQFSRGLMWGTGIGGLLGTAGFIVTMRSGHRWIATPPHPLFQGGEGT